MYRDSHGDSREQHEGSKRNVVGIRYQEIVVHSIAGSETQTEGKNDAGDADHERLANIAEEYLRIQFKPHQEQVQDEADVGDQRKKGKRGFGKDRLGEAGNVAENGRAEADAADHFGDHSRLSQFAKSKVNQARQADNDYRLKESIFT